MFFHSEIGLKKPRLKEPVSTVGFFFFLFCFSDCFLFLSIICVDKVFWPSGESSGLGNKRLRV